MRRFEQILWMVRRDYPELKLRAGRRFKYRPPRTIYYEQICGEEAEEATKAQKKLEQNCDETYVEPFESAKTSCEANMELEQEYILQLLHEVGHALSKHNNYVADVERLKMEREAWEKARELCDKYGAVYDEGLVEVELDTYRDWLDKRSRCEKCGLTRYQTKNGSYHCPKCEELE